MVVRSKNSLAVWLLVAGGLAAGCSVESDPPSGQGGRAGTGFTGSGGNPTTPPASSSGRIDVVGDAMVRLGLGKTIELKVKVLNDDDEPERLQPVSFNLAGRPEDSSLSSLVDTTDSQGIASVVLQAASRPVTFEVRATVGTERSATFSVSVSGVGFGSLRVSAPYDGGRAVSQRFVLALPNVTCDDAAYAVGDPKTVIAPGEDATTLVALPAEVPYAVLAVAESASGVTVAHGCVHERCQRSPADEAQTCEELVLRTQAEQEITVPFSDRPLTPASSLALSFTLEAGSTAAALGADIRGAINGVVRTSDNGQSAITDAEGRFWLDSLDAVLRDDEDDSDAIAFADALAEARQQGGSGPESSLSALLEVNDEGAGVVASSMAGRVRDALDTLTLHAELEYERGGEIAIRPTRIEALPLASGSPKPRVDLADTPAPELDFRLSDSDDTLRLRTLRFAPRLGALAAAALDRVTMAEGELDPELIQRAGCATLSEWLSKQTFADGSACAASCVERACMHSMARILDAASDALEAVDEARPYATLSGALMLSDDDGDLLAERMSADNIEGLWEPAPDTSLGDTLRGSASALE